MDDWIDTNSPAAKRVRKDSPSTSKKVTNNSSSNYVSSGTTSCNGVSIALTSPTSELSVCRYGSNCYRRNENHLMQFRHIHLEDAFQQMERLDNFSRLPSGFNSEGCDEATMLEQIKIMRSAGFTSSESRFSFSSENTSTEINVQTKAPSTSSSTPTASSNNKDSVISQLFLERRDRMKIKEEAKRKLVESLEETGQSPKIQKSPEGSKNAFDDNCMAKRLEKSSPFNMFLTKVRDIPTEKGGVLSASFTDLFCPSLGEVKALCLINFMFEASWLFDQMLEAGISGKPTWIICGEDNEELTNGAKAFPSLKIFRAKSPFPYGHHHTKMSFVQYTDLSVRFFVYTANLIESDWDNRTQGIWMSPRCPRVPQGSSPLVGESPTNFRSDILQYLSTYPSQATAAWKDVIKYADCSEIKVFFIASAPITTQSSLNGFQFGIKKMEKILRSFELDTEPNWHLNVQCSSIGTLGASSDDWLINEFGTALSGKDRCLMGSLNLIYPTEQNVRDSFDGVLGGGCLPYSAMTHMKQKWLNRHFHQWKADRSGRSRAPPHIKSYSRWSPDYSKMAWFLLTSANLSKAAWGKLNKQGNRLGIMSWEAGVLFIPEFLGSGNYFTPTESSEALTFPLYYDVPPVKYGKTDRPWFFETLQLAISE